MLSRVFHCALRQPSPWVAMRAAYSTQSMGDVASVFKEAAATKAQEQQQQHPESALRDRETITPFKQGRALNPMDLSYKARVSRKTYRSKPLQVAPTSKMASKTDLFHQLSIDPITLATYPLILSHFVTEMGQIKPRTLTGLTVKSQRRLGKAIRRARMMGVIPLLSRTPGFQWY